MDSPSPPIIESPPAAKEPERIEPDPKHRLDSLAAALRERPDAKALAEYLFLRRTLR